MIRLLMSSVFAALLSGVAFAQPDSVPTRKLTISPAAEPRPALRYELMPGIRDRTPGNAALAYFRSFLHRPASVAEPMKAESDQKLLAIWETTPLDQLPRDDVRKRLDTVRSLLRELDLAAGCDRCNWEMEPRIRTDGIAVLLPEVQPSREVIRYLSLRSRLELAENRYDDAAKSLRSGLQMAKNVGEGPTLIQLLVGLALQSIMLERVEDWIARPDSPNLYWALTTLPQPLIDPRIGFQGESLFLEAMVPNLAKLRNGPLPKDDAPRIIQGVLKDLGRLGGELNPEPNESKATLGQLGFAGYVVWQYPAAKQELIERGRPAKQVDDMAGSQVVFLNSLERFFEIRDAQWKWIGVPYYQARPGLRESETMYKKSREKYSTDLFFSVFSLVLPASDHVLFSVARQERRMAALRTIEAVRMHAATHGGTPPHQLADVKIVPVPNDPVTGKPFGYELKDRTVILTAAPPEGEAPSVNTALRYELLFR